MRKQQWHFGDSRFLMKEMGLGQHQTTIIYQDNQPAIRTMHNAGSMSNASRHLQMRILKMEELEGDQFTTKFCSSQRTLVDIGTKFVPAIAFWYLNDAICGYTTAPPPTDVGDGDQFDKELREQLTRDVRAQHRKEHTEVQEQELDVTTPEMYTDQTIFKRPYLSEYNELEAQIEVGLSPSSCGITLTKHIR